MQEVEGSIPFASTDPSLLRLRPTALDRPCDFGRPSGPPDLRLCRRRHGCGYGRLAICAAEALLSRLRPTALDRPCDFGRPTGPPDLRLCRRRFLSAAATGGLVTRRRRRRGGRPRRRDGRAASACSESSTSTVPRARDDLAQPPAVLPGHHPVVASPEHERRTIEAARARPPRPGDPRSRSCARTSPRLGALDDRCTRPGSSSPSRRPESDAWPSSRT